MIVEKDFVLEEIDDCGGPAEYIEWIMSRLAILSVVRVKYLPAKEEINGAMLLLRDAKKTITELDAMTDDTKEGWTET
jgi:hypothetical protein